MKHSSIPSHPNAAGAGGGYTAVAKWLHWVIASVWLAAWLIGFVGVHWRDALNPEHQLTFLHKAIASTVLFLTVVRVIWRLTHRPPALPDSISPLMQKAAHLGHLALYVLALFILPLSGWLLSSVAAQPVMLLGVVELPPLTGANDGQIFRVRQVHTWVGWACGLMVAGHILVALKHHLVDRDAILRQMLPERKD